LLLAWPAAPAPWLGSYVLESIGFYRLPPRSGEELDPKKGQQLHAGGFAEAPAKMNHYAWTTNGAIVQVHGQGPFAITYVNPADDPSKK
jgi:hypothetical protein